MGHDVKALQQTVESALVLLGKRLNLKVSKERLAELDEKAQDPHLWDDAQQAQSVLSERTRLGRSLEAYGESQNQLADLMTLWEMSLEEGDQKTAEETEQELANLAHRLTEEATTALLSGEADGCSAFMEIHAGAGGTEACDWAEILLRMYARYSEKVGYKMTVLDELAGEEAGIRSVVVKFSGHNAYGWLKTESGVHRLVRISPFDSGARRHTSFASVWVYPEIDDQVEVSIDEKDLRIDVYRASGAGGQHVNTTESAVRITHIPTNIVVQCQNERSQHKNKAAAMKMLKARLFEVEIQKREAEKQDSHAAKTDIGWGHQIRSYVLHPYQMIKDLRTGYTSSDTQGTLDGNIHPFLRTSLEWRLEGTLAGDLNDETL